jgi:Ca-activated chloride channel family protein
MGATMILGRISWQSAKVLYYLWPLLILVALVLIRKYVWQKSVSKLLVAKNHQTLLHHFSLGRKLIKLVLLLVALVFLFLALARPQWGTAKEVVAQEGRDVLIALDVSRSMLVQDVTPSRLAFAKQKIKSLVDALTAERLGLMVFSGNALILCPFTADTQAFANFLDLVEVEEHSTGTTALDKALTQAIATFNAVPQRKHRIMILFTDGEDFSPHLEQVKEKAKAAGLTIFAVGVGTNEGGPIPLYDDKGVFQGHQKDKNGAVIMSRLQEQVLTHVAEQTGAYYVHATQDDSDIQQLMSQIRHFEKEKFEDKSFAAKQDRYAYFAAFSLLFLLVEWLL